MSSTDTGETSTQSLSKIPILQAPTQWIGWKRLIHEYLSMHGYGDLLRRNKTKPQTPDAGEELNKTIIKWEDRQQRACAYISNRLGANARSLIENTEEILAVRLDTLETRYKPRGSAIYDELSARYENLTLASCGSVNKFTEKLREARDDLTDLDDYCKVSETQFLRHFLKGLGPKYAVFLTTFNQTHNILPERDQTNKIIKEPVLFSEVASLAEREEQRQKMQNQLQKEAETQNVALISKTNSQLQKRKLQPQLSRANRESLTCDHCKMQRHHESECWFKHPHLKKEFHDRQQARKKAKQDETDVTTATDKQKQDFQAIAYSIPQTLLAHVDTFSANQLEVLRHVYILDSGATNNTFADRRKFTNLRPYTGEPVTGLGGVKVTPEQIGNYTLDVNIHGQRESLVFRDAYYSPLAGVNLVSTSALQVKGVHLQFSHTGVVAQTNKKIIFTAALHQGLNLINIWKPNPAGEKFLLAHSAEDPDMKLWHERLGHLGYDSIQKLKQMSTGIRPIKLTNNCDACAQSNNKESPHKGVVLKGTYPFESLHADISGPYPYEAYNSCRYWLAVVDDFTGYSWAIPIQRRSDTCDALQKLLQQNETTERRCRLLRLDLGGENASTTLKDMISDRGIQCTYTGTEQHQSNGLVEATHGVLQRRLTATLTHSQLPMKYWPLILQTVTYLKNLTPNRRIQKTPYEAWTGHKPDLNHLRVIGSKGYYLLPQQTRRLKNIGKLEPPRRPCRMMGYHGAHYKIVLTDDDKIVVTNNTIFNDHGIELALKRQAEDTSSAGGDIDYAASPSSKRPKVATEEIPLIQLPFSHSQHCPHSAGKVSPANTLSEGSANSPEPPSPTMHATSPPEPLEPVEPQTAEPAEQHPADSIVVGNGINQGNHTSQTPFTTHYNLRSRPAQVAKDTTFATRFAFTAMMSHLVLVSLVQSEVFEPHSWKEARKTPQWPQWLTAMKEEHMSLLDNHTYDLVTLPTGKHALSGKWVYKVKRGPRGEIRRYKARWVVRGFMQRSGIDYHETFAAVVKPMSYKAIFAIAAALDLELHQMDVKTAFLYGDIDDEIYVEQPPGLGPTDDRVCRLRKALYGLKQSPRIWYQTLTTFLTSLGFSPLTADSGVFVRGTTFIAIYVDDLLMAGASLEELNGVKDALSKKFNMTDLGPCSHYLGMSIRRDRQSRALYLSQQAYLEKIIRDMGLWDANPVTTPMEVNTIDKTPEGYQAADDQRHLYARMIGSLMYAMLGTRPDIAYSVSFLSRYLGNPTPQHIKAAKRVFRYLKGTINYELVYRGDLGPLTGWTDADWGGDVDTRRSTGGFIFNIGSASISWQSKRQPVVALSSCEAELMAETQAAKEAIWLRKLLTELQAYGEENITSTIIYGDNQGAIALAKDPQFHPRTKHIDIQHLYVREAQKEGHITMAYTPTASQIADGLTKPLPKDSFIKFRNSLGLEERKTN